MQKKENQAESCIIYAEDLVQTHWTLPVLAALVSVSPQAPCLVDSKGLVSLASSISLGLTLFLPPLPWGSLSSGGGI